MIGVQAAASLVLLVIAALLTRATISATQVDIGFDAKPLVTIAPQFVRERYDSAKTQAYWNVALERLRAIPNVQAVSLTLFPPYSGGSSQDQPQAERRHLRNLLARNARRLFLHASAFASCAAAPTPRMKSGHAHRSS